MDLYESSPFSERVAKMSFLLRGLDNVSTEMSLNVLTVNLKRVMRLLGFQQTMKALRSMGLSPSCDQ